jgi:hypothetical protein
MQGIMGVNRYDGKLGRADEPFNRATTGVFRPNRLKATNLGRYRVCR